ncbi:MAG: hypothetical protein RL030_2220 [Pseudomonadota bacterium]
MRQGRLPGLLLCVTLAAAASAAEPLRVYGNTTTMEIAPVLLAVSASGGVEAKVINGGVPDLFRRDRAQLATNAETQALRASVDNPDLRIILTVSEGLYRIVGRRSAGIGKLSDLKGKRIATIPNTSSAFYLSRMLASVGLGEADVTIVPVLPLSRMPQALASGEVDAVTIWEPEIQHAAERIGKDAIEFQDIGIYRELFNLHATAPQLADPVQRARIVAFVREVLRATQQLHADPRAAWAKVARSSQYDEATVAKVWHHEAFPGYLAPNLLEVLVAEEPWVARERSRTPRTREQLAQLIDASVLRDALAAEPSLAVRAPSPQEVRHQADALRLARLEQAVSQVEGLRAARRLQHALNQYRLAGQWDEAASLFTRDARWESGDVASGGKSIAGRLAIREALGAESNGGPLRPGMLNAHLLLSPVLSFDPDGQRIRGRWHQVSMTGIWGERADWAGGILENEYALEDGVWRIARMHYYPAFAGPYSPGWRNADRSDRVAVVPFHYTPARAGLPVPRPFTIDAPHSFGNEREQQAQLATLRGRLQQLQDETAMLNLQSAWGYYSDRRMWNDMADLFASNGRLQMDGAGRVAGREKIRAALSALSPEGLEPGVLNDHIELQPVVTLAPDGRSARVSGTELAMTGRNDAEAWWGLNRYDNRYEKRDGTWQLADARITRQLRSDYAQGWARNAEPSPQGGYPTRAAPRAAFPNPAASTPRVNAVSVRASLDEQLIGLERELDIALAANGAENVSNAYGYYIDEFLWDESADLFSLKGSKELSYIGTYIGREHVRESMIARYGRGGRRAASMAIHQKTEPYVTAAADGRSAQIRERLFQVNSARETPGSYISGVYENGIVREDGVWKISRMDLDYAWTASVDGGWSRVSPEVSRRFAPTTPQISIAPDAPLRGVTYAPYPGIAPMAFHFANPVSGREPPERLPVEAPATVPPAPR